MLQDGARAFAASPASAKPEYIVNSARSLTPATILVIRARADHVGSVDNRCECKP